MSGVTERPWQTVIYLKGQVEGNLSALKGPGAGSCAVFTIITVSVDVATNVHVTIHGIYVVFPLTGFLYCL